jgi:hypothetical protein
VIVGIPEVASVVLLYVEVVAEVTIVIGTVGSKMAEIVVVVVFAEDV